MKKTLLILVVCTVSVFSIFGGGKKEANSISFAGSGGYPPFNFILDDGSVDGFDVDVAKEIAKRLGKQEKYVTTSWDGIIEAFAPAAMMNLWAVWQSQKNACRLLIFHPLLFSRPQLIVRKDSGLTDISDFTEDHVVALVTGTTFEKDAEKAGLKFKLYEDDNQTLMELINGRVDGVLTDRIVGLNAMSKMKGGDNLTIAGSVLRTESMGIAFKKNSALTEQVNAALKAMREDGTLRAISEKWFPGEDITVE